MNGEINISVPENRIIFEKGLDSWDIGITDFESQEARFSEFRKQWLVQNK